MVKSSTRHFNHALDDRVSQNWRICALLSSSVDTRLTKWDSWVGGKRTVRDGSVWRGSWHRTVGCYQPLLFPASSGRVCFSRSTSCAPTTPTHCLSPNMRVRRNLDWREVRRAAARICCLSSSRFVRRVSTLKNLHLCKAFTILMVWAIQKSKVVSRL